MNDRGYKLHSPFLGSCYNRLSLRQLYKPVQRLPTSLQEHDTTVCFNVSNILLPFPRNQPVPRMFPIVEPALSQPRRIVEIVETYGIERGRIGGLDVRVRGAQWIPRSGCFHLPGNLGHAAQNLIVRSKRHRMEGKRFPVRGETEYGR